MSPITSFGLKMLLQPAFGPVIYKRGSDHIEVHVYQDHSKSVGLFIYLFLR